MKLTEIAIDGMSQFSHLRLGPFSEGLNFIYGEHQAGKSTLRQFLRGIFRGHDIDPARYAYSSPNGHIRVRNGMDEFQLERDFVTSATLKVRSQGTTSIAATESLEQFCTRLNSDIHDAIFNFGLRKTAENSLQLISVLRNQLGIPAGVAAAGDEQAYLAWKRQSDARAQQLIELQNRIDQLESRRIDVSHQLQSVESQRQQRLADWERNLEIVRQQIANLDADQLRNRLAFLNSEIVNLRSLIEKRQNEVTYVQTPASNVDVLTVLYQYLDEIDNQVRRSRQIQAHAQAQRVRLKDEMAVWDDLTLESDEHPYHTAREILIALQQKIDRTEHISKNEIAAREIRPEDADPVSVLENLCGQMGNDLQGLCQELSQQYKHIRHRAAAMELKHLRRCYHEINENVQQLLTRRNSIVDEIRRLDPPGANAIVRAEVDFCQCAIQEGHYEARRQFVSDPPVQTTQTTAVRVGAAELTEEKLKLSSLEREYADVSARLGHAESERLTLQSRESQLIKERESLTSEYDSRRLQDELNQVEAQLQSAKNEHRDLQQRIDADRRIVPPTPHPVLVRAAELLNRISSGQLTQVWISDSDLSRELQIRNQIGKVLNFSALNATEQDQVYLCLAFSAAEKLATQGISAPVVVDDAFAHVTRDQVNVFLELYSGFAKNGHQLFLLTQHQFIADRLPGTPVFELQPVEIANSTSDYAYSTPDDSIISASVDFENDSRLHIFDWNSKTSYPLSKYPSADEGTRYEDTESYIVPHPTIRSGLNGPSFVAQPLSIGNGQYTPVSVDRIGDQLGFATAIDEQTSLDQIELFDARVLRMFADLGIRNVGQLFELEADRLNRSLRDNGITEEQLARWQAQMYLMCHVPGLRLNDVRVLVACGIRSPEHLATSDSSQLYERIQRFLNSNDGYRFRGSSGSLSRDRVHGWIRASNATRSRWHRKSRFSTGSRDFSVSDRDHQDAAPQNREPRIARPPRMRTPEPRRTAPAIQPVSAREFSRRQPVRNETSSASIAAEPEQGSRTQTSNKKTSDNLRFYLDLNDHIEAAPSIGPKTAERFEKIGVATVEQFLRQTAESMASNLNYKRITADVILNWQHQARLVCRVPNLRGHDAQLLVACNFTEPEKIAALEPKKLFGIIGPFSETKEGQKIIRSGKKPDLEEITDWINWAAQERSVVAA